MGVDLAPQLDPRRHTYEPNGDGHDTNPRGCWWCGRPREAHASEIVYENDEDGGAVPVVREIEAGEGGEK